MKNAEQSTENDISGDVHGTSLQAESIGDVYLAPPAKPRWFSALQAAMVVVVITGVMMTAAELAPTTQPIKEMPVAATGSAPAESAATSSPAAAARAQASPTMAGAARPVPSGSTPRTAGGTSVTAAPTTTTTVTAAAPTIIGTGSRYTGELRFGSFHLDLATPRDVPGSNVWALTPTRLHGDPGYWLAAWHSDGVPGRDECVGYLRDNATLDADNVVVGSRVCGQTPEGRIFRIDVTVLDGSAITGQVTVWE